MKGLPILSERGIPLRSRVLLGVLGFFLGFSSWVSFRVSMLLCLLIRLGFSCNRFGAAYAVLVVIVCGILI